MTAPRFTLHHAPRSRSFRTLWLLEEARAPYALSLHDLEKATQKDPGYLAIHPDGKVPALIDHGPDGNWSVVVTDSAAICAYVADVLPDSGLAPPPGSPERGAYATWMAYAPSVLEPAVADTMFPRQAEPPARAIGWPPFAAAFDRVARQLTDGPWLLGARFSAADVMIGSLLRWLNSWGKVPRHDAVQRYLDALATREGLRWAEAKEAETIGG